MVLSPSVQLHLLPRKNKLCLAISETGQILCVSVIISQSFVDTQKKYLVWWKIHVTQNDDIQMIHQLFQLSTAMMDLITSLVMIKNNENDVLSNKHA